MKELAWLALPAGFLSSWGIDALLHYVNPLRKPCIFTGDYAADIAVMCVLWLALYGWSQGHWRS